MVKAPPTNKSSTLVCLWEGVIDIYYSVEFIRRSKKNSKNISFLNWLFQQLPSQGSKVKSMCRGLGRSWLQRVTSCWKWTFAEPGHDWAKTEDAVSGESLPVCCCSERFEQSTCHITHLICVIPPWWSISLLCCQLGSCVRPAETLWFAVAMGIASLPLGTHIDCVKNGGSHPTYQSVGGGGSMNEHRPG